MEGGAVGTIHWWEEGDSSWRGEGESDKRENALDTEAEQETMTRVKQTELWPTVKC